MSWFRLDDQGAFNPKVLRAGNEAYGAWCRAGQWASQHLTDGLVPVEVAVTIAPPRVWAKLRQAGLVDEGDDTAFQIHDFLDWNPTAAEVRAERDRKRRNIAEMRARRKTDTGVDTGEKVTGPVTGYKPGTGPASAAPVSGVCSGPDPDPREEEECRFSLLNISDPSAPDLVREVYEHWLAGWRRVIGGTNPPKLDDTRRDKIKRRLADGYTVAQIKQAIDALWASEFHVSGKHYDLELVCRSRVKLDGFLAQATPVAGKAPSAPQAVPIRRSAAELRAALAGCGAEDA